MPESTSDSPDSTEGAPLEGEVLAQEADPRDVAGAADSDADSNAVASESAEPSPVRTSGLSGMSRWLTITLIAIVSVMALTIATVAIVAGVQSYNEARAEAISTYEDSFNAYQVAVREFESEILSAEREILTTSEMQLTDASILPALQDTVKASKETLSQAGGRAELDKESSSNDELETEGAELDQTKRSVETSTRSVKKSTDAFISDKEAKRQADEEARKAAELAKKKAGAQSVGYENLFRAGESAAGTYYRFEGKIIQDAGSGTYRVNMTKEPGYSMVFWEDTILVMILGAPSQRLLEDDIISFVGVSTGIQSYETIFGATVELPAVIAEGSDVSVTGRDS